MQTTVSGYAISGTDASNYTLTSQPSGLTADITKKSLTVTGVTAADKVYNGTTAATLSGGTLSGLVTGDLVTLTKGTGVFASKNAGTGKAITASGYSLSGTDASNYTISQPSGLTADITRKSLTVTGVTAADKVYNGTTAATLSGGTLSGLVTGDVVTLTKGTGVFASKKVGTGKAITASGYAISGTGASNYTISQPSGITADITPAPLTIKAADAEKGRYEEDPVFTVTYIGFVAGDNSSAVSGLVVEREPGEKPGTYSIIPSGASAANYEIEYVNGTFTINGSTSVLNNHITVNENKISRPVKGIFIGSNPVSLSSAKADFRIVAGYPSELRVTIYDASGNAVFEKNASAYTGTVDMSWNLYTNGGHRAGSGVYLIVAKVKSRVNGSSEVLMEKLGLR
ncbi:MAG: hypothetical protein GX556_05830 [Fibrobacter sp.]|nr:hypothetical protein [Fibrobacter sp.]